MRKRWNLLLLGALAMNGLAAQAMSLSSPAIKDGGTLTEDEVYRGYGCAGKNISPALSWSGAPAGTKSFAISVYDPDAPVAGGWWHWFIYDIPAGVVTLPANAGDPKQGMAPRQSVQAVSSFGSPGFGGACPPVGNKPHRYVFTVYALGIDRLNVPDTAGAASVADSVAANTLARASLTATYGR